MGTGQAGKQQTQAYPAGTGCGPWSTSPITLKWKLTEMWREVVIGVMGRS